MILSASLLTALLSPTAITIPLSKEWQFTEGREFPGAKGSLRVDEKGVLHVAFDFRGGGAYVGVYQHLEEPLELQALTFRVKKPRGVSLGVRLTDSTGQTVQKHIAYEHGDWQPLRVEMGGWTGHWGGANDGVLHPPIHTVGILLESRDLESPIGEFLIADVVAHVGVAESPSLVYQEEYFVTDFRDEALWRVSRNGTLRKGTWNVDLSREETASLGGSLSFLGSPQRFRLQVRGGSPGNVLVMRLGSHFQGFEREVGVLNGELQTFLLPAPPEGWRFGGGENDGKVRYPLRFTGLALKKGSATDTQTTVELVELTCETITSLADVITLAANLKENGSSSETRTLTATCSAWNLFPETVTGTLSLTLSDWEGHLLSRAEEPWRLPPKGVRAEKNVVLTVPLRLNFVEVEFTFTADRAHIPPKRAQATYTRPPDDAGDSFLRPESPWGMGVYLYRYPDNPEGHALMEKAAALAQAAGVKWSREEFSWSRIEPKKGQFDFAFYDRVVETARKHGISIYALLAYWTPWTKAYSEEGIEDFVQWTRVLVRRYKDRIHHWEIYNEPNIFFWEGDKTLYPVLLRRAYAAIKEEDPHALVLGISTAGVDTAFIRFCLERDAPFDILTIHPYRSVLREKTFINQLRETAQLVGGRPVWITEMGWSTHIGATNEREQAKLLARCYLASVVSGACQNVSWYNFRNDGKDPFYNEHNFGVLRSDLSPKPAYRALMTVCRTLSEGRRQPLDLGNDVLGLRVGEKIALWSPTSTRRIQLRMGKGSPRLLNLMGEDITPSASENTWTVTLDEGSPVFVRGGDVEILGTSAPADSEKPRPEIRF